MIEMENEANLIRYIIRNIIDNRSSEIEAFLCSNSFNWQRFKELSIYHEISPFVYLSLKEFNRFLPEDLIGFLKNNYYCAIARGQNLIEEFLRILTVFEQAKIDLIPIKGIVLQEDVYREIPFRVFLDIDLLIKEDNIIKAKDLFYELGYQIELIGCKEQYWREKQCHLTFFKRDIKSWFLVDLHWILDFKRGKSDVLPGLWNNLRNINIKNRTVKILSVEDTLFSLALHQRRWGKTLCLKNVCDVALLLNKYADSFDWGYVLETAKKERMCTTIFFILTQVNVFFGINLPIRLEKEFRVSVWKRKLIVDFIKKNTFTVFKNKKKQLYIMSHYLLYENFWEPTTYIMNIPLEQFAKYYEFRPYEKKTLFLYRWRFFYVILRYVAENIIGAKRICKKFN